MYKPFLAPYKEVEVYLKKIYSNGIVTNNGPLVRELEEKLKEYLGVKHLFITGNATIGLQMAISALDIKNGDIINSAFSYVAAPSAIVSNSYRNVFADINPDTYCINPVDIEKKITSHTKAILPTNIFNTVCDTEAIQQIADKYNLKVIYDSAHSFGVKYEGKSVFTHGDVSVCSMHAYKVLNMVEGGFITTNDDEIAEKLYEVRYFGANRNNDGFNRIGFNGKNSEFHAAIGLANFKYLDISKQKRIEMYSLYFDMLKDFPLQWQKVNSKIESNYAYLPLVFENNKVATIVKRTLENKNIFTRRYFHPSLNKLDFLGNNQPMPIAESISDRILCFPFYFGLKDKEISFICNEIIQVLESF